MADGFTLQIDDELARKIERAAAGAGMSREDFARLLLDQRVFDYDDYRWRGDDPRATPAVSVHESPRPWSDVKGELAARLEDRLRQPR